MQNRDHVFHIPAERWLHQYLFIVDTTWNFANRKSVKGIQLCTYIGWSGYRVECIQFFDSTTLVLSFFHSPRFHNTSNIFLYRSNSTFAARKYLVAVSDVLFFSPIIYKIHMLPRRCRVKAISILGQFPAQQRHTSKKRRGKKVCSGKKRRKIWGEKTSH